MPHGRRRGRHQHGYAAPFDHALRHGTQQHPGYASASMAGQGNQVVIAILCKLDDLPCRLTDSESNAWLDLSGGIVGNSDHLLVGRAVSQRSAQRGVHVLGMGMLDHLEDHDVSGYSRTECFDRG